MNRRHALVAAVGALGLASAIWVAHGLLADPAAGRIVPVATGPATGVWTPAPEDADAAPRQPMEVVRDLVRLDLGSDGRTLVAILADGSTQRATPVWNSPGSADFTLRNRAGRPVAVSLYQPGAGTDLQIGDPCRTLRFIPAP